MAEPVEASERQGARALDMRSTGAAGAAFLHWSLAPADWVLGETEVHVWSAWLRASPARLEALALTLSEDENERAARFHFQCHRHSYVCGRAWLRRIIGRCLNLKPAEVRFHYNPNGKPLIRGLHFNLSHCEDLALIAVSRAGRVGVDVERVRVLENAGELVAQFFAPRERVAYDRLPPEKQPQAFFNLWTRKEALLKATGDGIGHLLSEVEVAFVPGEPARLVRLPQGQPAGNHWGLCELQPATGFAAALAFAGNVAADPPAKESAGGASGLKCWRWTDL